MELNSFIDFGLLFVSSLLFLISTVPLSRLSRHPLITGIATEYTTPFILFLHDALFLSLITSLLSLQL